ncbi:uncharacterized protein LOC144255457 [Urocitellus parryii]
MSQRCRPPGSGSREMAGAPLAAPHPPLSQSPSYRESASLQHPSSPPPRIRGEYRDKGAVGRGLWQARSGLFCALRPAERLSGVRKRTIAVPGSRGAAESPAHTSCPAPPSSAGRRVEPRSRDLGERDAGKGDAGLKQLVGVCL